MTTTTQIYNNNLVFSIHFLIKKNAFKLINNVYSLFNLYVGGNSFFIAFNISYLGHRYLTFSQLENQKQLSLPHFFLVATSAGALNEVLYYLLLSYTKIHYLLALVVVLGLAAIYSFFLSRFWACR
jgi:hypothetical protein